MRIAKIAEGDVDGGGNPGGGFEPDAAGAGADGEDGAGAAAAAESGTESARRRGPGGSLRGRGGVAMGFNAFGVSFAPAASAEPSAGSDGVRVLGAAPAVATSGNDGLGRRRIGGGWLSGAIPPAASTASTVGSFNVGVAPANEIVGAIGALSALAEAAKSGPSPGRTEGGTDAAPESRLGFGGGASLRANGGEES